MTRPTLLAGLMVAAATRAAVAQTIVSGVRNLDFGVVIQGIAAAVPPSDPVRSGQFYFRTPAIGSRVRIQFTLPTRLNGPSGATMAIAFRNNDAIAQGTAPASVPVTFNPNGAAVFVMTTSADANVWLGARVTPTAAQAVGTYSNTVIMTVTVF